MKIKKINIPISKTEDSIIEAEYIGAGSFAKCYRVGDSVYSLVKIPARYEVDCSKEIVSNIDSDNPHLPKIQTLGENNKLENVYKMPYYKKLYAKDSAYKEAKKLINLFNNQLWSGIYSNKKPYDSYYANIEFIELCKKEKIADSIIEALELINDSSSNYGSYYQFEFFMQNLKISESGHLILLDVLFNRIALDEMRNAKKR